jgi:hypothetical protein
MLWGNKRGTRVEIGPMIDLKRLPSPYLLPFIFVPISFLEETRNYMQGAYDRILLLKKYVGNPQLSAAERAVIEDELGELSKMLDTAENILGEHVR